MLATQQGAHEKLHRPNHTAVRRAICTPSAGLWPKSSARSRAFDLWDLHVLGRDDVVPACRAGATTVTLWLREAGRAAGAAEGLVEADLDWPNLCERRRVKAALVLRLKGSHAVAAPVLVHDIEHGLLADEVALVNDELPNALGPDIHHVEAPAVALGEGATRRSRRGVPAEGGGHRPLEGCGGNNSTQEEHSHAAAACRGRHG
mmetsp:Transcript_61682/g.125768  ORF Transcript_61682/g.125768 Transcript_61682/m.125768 type:complete len:204 (-) Transcript_61682:61-672(-)